MIANAGKVKLFGQEHEDPVVLGVVKLDATQGLGHSRDVFGPTCTIVWSLLTPIVDLSTADWFGG